MTIKKSVHVQYRHNHHTPNYIIYINNNVTSSSSKYFHLKLVESTDVEPGDMQGQLNIISLHTTPAIKTRT